MRQTSSTDRRGFKALELVVTLFMAIVMVAVAIPAVESSSDSSQQTACKAQMQYLAKVVLAYEMQKRQYPGYRNVLRMDNGRTFADPQTGEKRAVSWVVMILPYIEHQQELFAAWREPGNAKIARIYNNEEAAEPDDRIRILTCPGDNNMTMRKCGLSYVVNSGMRDWSGLPTVPTNQGIPTDWPENGVFFDTFQGNPLVGMVGPDKKPLTLPIIRMSNDYIARADGVGQTCMLSENADAGRYTDDTEAAVGMIWNGSGRVNTAQDPPSLDPPDPEMRIPRGEAKATRAAKTTIAHARPSSAHPGGVNMAFCDGRVRFVRDDMNYYVYSLMMSSNGSRVRLPGSNKVLQNFNRPLVETWYIGN
jgi:prepilin-type processing-associated H-X9-DG protein